jgi:hypothetical protein
VGSPQTVSLSGIGVTQGTVAFTSASLGDIVGDELNFGSLGGGWHESTVTITVSDAPVLFESLTVAGGRFRKSSEDGSDTCSGTLVAAAGTCTVAIDFRGNGNSERSGTLTVSHYGTGSPQTLNLLGR